MSLKKGKSNKKARQIASAIAYKEAKKTKNESFDNIVNDYLKLFIFDEAIMPNQQPAPLTSQEQQAIKKAQLKKAAEDSKKFAKVAATKDPRELAAFRAGMEISKTANQNIGI